MHWSTSNNAARVSSFEAFNDHVAIPTGIFLLDGKLSVIRPVKTYESTVSGRFFHSTKKRGKLSETVWAPHTCLLPYQSTGLGEAPEANHWALRPGLISYFSCNVRMAVSACHTLSTVASSLVATIFHDFHGCLSGQYHLDGELTLHKIPLIWCYKIGSAEGLNAPGPLHFGILLKIAHPTNIHNVNCRFRIISWVVPEGIRSLRASCEACPSVSKEQDWSSQKMSTIWGFHKWGYPKMDVL